MDESRQLDSIETIDESTVTMANDNLDVIFKSLRLVPEFDGNPHVLTRFINICDQLVISNFKTTVGNELNNLALINGILNKVTGPAARLINSSGIPETWEGIRSALINNFADHRDETALYNDLSMQTQGSSTPQEFYEKCQNLYSTIMTYVSLHETVRSTIEAKRDLYRKLTLQAYLRGLKDPLGCRIRCMRPATVEQALEFVQEELNTLYMQQRNEGPSRKEYQPQLPPSNFNLPLNNFSQRMPIFNMPGPSRQNIINNHGPSKPLNMPYQPNQGWKNNNWQQPPRGPTRTQQMFRAPPPNYNPQSNVFRIPNRNQPQQSFKFGPPRPMSGVAPFVSKPLPPSGHDWTKFGNPPPSNYFKSREINFNDFYYDNPYYEYDYNQVDYYNNDYNNYDQYYDCNYVEDQSWCEEPSVEEVDQKAPSSEDQNFHKGSKSDIQK